PRARRRPPPGSRAWRRSPAACRPRPRPPAGRGRRAGGRTPGRTAPARARCRAASRRRDDDARRTGCDDRGATWPDCASRARARTLGAMCIPASAAPRARRGAISIFWRVVAVNVAVLALSALLLIVTPVRITPRIAAAEAAIVIAGFVVLTAISLLLLRGV